LYEKASQAPAPAGVRAWEAFSPKHVIQEVFMESFIHKELSYKVLGMAYAVHNILGPGLLESAYQKAMCVELRQAGIPYKREQVFPLEYKGEDIGTYKADIVVDDKIILELKSVEELYPWMEAQLINYLKVSGIPVGYLINFRDRQVEWKRCVNGANTLRCGG
jgi:GxxExxY protein